MFMERSPGPYVSVLSKVTGSNGVSPRPGGNSRQNISGVFPLGQ